MEKCCNNCRFELYNPDEIPCKDCGMDNLEYWMPKPQTNADRIQEMEDQAPQPLSIDELRQMIGQPVWVTHRDGSGGRWGIVNEYSGSLCADVESGQAYWFYDYIGTVAYRHRPITQGVVP